MMQELDLKVNRPHGWDFQKITDGEIKYMKLWQVSVAVVRPVLQNDLTLRHLARSLEFQHQWLPEPARPPQQNRSCIGE